jgi:small subunit ribosomal protein S18
MAKDRDRRKGASDRRRVIKKKVSVLTTENIAWVDYKDVNLLRRFMSERAKIRARRVTGNSAQQQRAVARAIRVAREMALLPYSVRQVTQRSRKRDRDLARGLAAEPTEPGGAGAPVGSEGAEGALAEGAPVEDAVAAGAESTLAEPVSPPAADEGESGPE